MFERGEGVGMSWWLRKQFTLNHRHLIPSISQIFQEFF